MKIAGGILRVIERAQTMIRPWLRDNKKNKLHAINFDQIGAVV